MLPRAALLSLVLLSSPLPAAALPALFFRRNDCDDTAVNRQSTGPGVCPQVLVASGFDQPTGGNTFPILITGFDACATAGFPDPYQTYALGVIESDMRWAADGPDGGPGLRGDADRSVCLSLIAARWTNSSGARFPFALGSTHLTWQGEPSTGFRPTGGTPSVRSSWSRIRARSRRGPRHRR